MRRCLMLDVDGVLVRGRPADGRPWATDLERDMGIDPGALQAAFFAVHWEEIVIGKRDLHGTLAGCLHRIAPDVSADAFIAYWFAMDSRIDRDLLAQCDDLRGRGITIYLATNQEHLRARYLLKELGLANHVDGLVYSAAVGARKPQAEFFAAAAAESGFSPGALMLVDDTGANVDAARAAGWLAVRWTGTERLTDLLPL